jgi:hypothetical protein
MRRGLVRAEVKLVHTRAHLESDLALRIVGTFKLRDGDRMTLSFKTQSLGGRSHILERQGV